MIYSVLPIMAAYFQSQPVDSVCGASGRTASIVVAAFFLASVVLLGFLIRWGAFHSKGTDASAEIAMTVTT